MEAIASRLEAIATSNKKLLNDRFLFAFCIRRFAFASAGNAQNGRNTQTQAYVCERKIPLSLLSTGIPWSSWVRHSEIDRELRGWKLCVTEVHAHREGGGGKRSVKLGGGRLSHHRVLRSVRSVRSASGFVASDRGFVQVELLPPGDACATLDQARSSGLTSLLKPQA